MTSYANTAAYTYPNGDAVTRTDTDRAQLSGIAYNGTTVDTRTYDDGGRMTGSTYNNGVGESRVYNTDSTLASISYTGASIGNLTYGWDKNKTSETITGTMSNYGFTVPSSGYDDEDRLTAWNRADANLNQSWNLTAVGDWTSITENGVAQSHTHGPTHEMLTAAGQTVTHDTKGNTTSIPAILRPSSTAALSLTWDQDNRMSSATDGTVTVSYQFDALGRRVARTESAATTVYVQNGQQTFADYTLGAVATSPSYTYTYASYIDEPVLRTGTGDWRYYHCNQQYSVNALTDPSGNVKERYAYTAYGTPSVFDGAGVAITSSAENNRYMYTGREWDEEAGLYHYRARMYDSVSGRFVGRDPIGFDGGSYSVYEYVGANALLRIDPTGLRSPWGSPWGAGGVPNPSDGPRSPTPTIFPVHPALPPPRNGGVPAFTRTNITCTCRNMSGQDETEVTTPCGNSGGSGTSNASDCFANACGDLGPQWVIKNRYGDPIWRISIAPPTPVPTLEDCWSRSDIETSCARARYMEVAACGLGTLPNAPTTVLCVILADAQYNLCMERAAECPNQ